MPWTPWRAGLSALARSALEDEALLEKVDGWVIGAVLRVVEQHRHEVGQLIAQTVSAWDPEETSRRIELLVGRDLQFIRINGTLVGGLVGLTIYSVTTIALIAIPYARQRRAWMLTRSAGTTRHAVLGTETARSAGPLAPPRATGAGVQQLDARMRNSFHAGVSCARTRRPNGPADPRSGGWSPN